jgi:hypothetical protein
VEKVYRVICVSASPWLYQAGNHHDQKRKSHVFDQFAIGVGHLITFSQLTSQRITQACLA